MTTTPLTDQELAAELLLKNQLAAAFEHMDAHQWGYDHGFCGEYGVDPETDSFVDTALALVRPDLDRLAAELATSRSENTRLCGEITGARATIDHMSKAMSWICGHDRQGLDHLEEAQREIRGRESAVKEARRWAARTEQAEAELGRVRAELTTTRERPQIDVETLARLLHDADVFVNDGDYPTWDDLSTTPGLGQDDVRKAARYLLRRLLVTPVSWNPATAAERPAAAVPSA